MSKFKDLMAQARQRESEPRDDDTPIPEPARTKEAAKAPAKELSTTRMPAPKAGAASAPARPADTNTPNGAPTGTDSAIPSDAVLLNDAEISSRGRGRPPGPAGGKRSHPDYEQVSAYLPRQTYREVKLALLQTEVTTGDKQEFSTLVAELLFEWLKNQKSK